jgi:hypothetical protein
MSSQPPFLPLLFSLLLLQYCIASENSTSCSENFNQSARKSDENEDSGSVPPPSACKLYVAPSTLPNAGMGIFTSVKLKKEEVIDNGDVIIPLIDLEYYQEYEDTFNLFLPYLWESTCFGMQLEAQSPHSTYAYAPGLLSLMNTHRTLNNVWRGAFEYDASVGGHRSESPSSGSMTPYWNSQSIASTDIPAGTELFIDYGDDWLEQHQHEVQANVNITTSRSVKQLESIGRCIDNIAVGESTLEFAGRGAFATRDLAKDTIITGSPLIHIPHESLLYLYKIYHDDQLRENIIDFNDMNGFQGVLNYCFSHLQIPMVLCPYGVGVNYINHHQLLSNVKLQWTPNSILNQNDEWLSKSPDDFEDEYKPRLSIDYVATRDIKEGEELFLDYGDEFEEAWEEFLEDWQPLGGQSAAHWNFVNGEEPLRSKKEQDWRPYPPNLELRCHPSVFFGDYIDLQQEDDEEELWPNHEKGRALVCEVHSWNIDEDDTYTVHVFHPEYDQAITRRHVARSMIQMVDRAYTTDWHRRDAFRHWISLPDELVPEAWRFDESDLNDN